MFSPRVWWCILWELAIKENVMGQVLHGCAKTTGAIRCSAPHLSSLLSQSFWFCLWRDCFSLTLPSFCILLRCALVIYIPAMSADSFCCDILPIFRSLFSSPYLRGLSYPDDLFFKRSKHPFCLCIPFRVTLARKDLLDPHCADGFHKSHGCWLASVIRYQLDPFSSCSFRTLPTCRLVQSSQPVAVFGPIIHFPP